MTQPSASLSVVTYPTKDLNPVQVGSHLLESGYLLEEEPLLDPNELFTKNTILEVKAVQLRLRRDADAKQEELRLMVGERYRDLLQASSSIISMEQTSRSVNSTLLEVKKAILSQSPPPVQKRTSMKGVTDIQLHIFQLLSAHMKLLLDAPEHLWRMIERKKYLHAAWLFLLSRAVHRALLNDENLEGDSWKNRGIDILEHFPIVQRQWDVVSSFRTQIIHRATQSLREHEAPAESVCATLLTLHILDSRPLTETLVTMLEQRTKALRTLLQQNSPASSHDKYSSQNSFVEKSTIFRRMPVDDSKDAIRLLLDLVFITARVARQIFKSVESSPSLIDRILLHFQTGTTPQAEQDSPIAELYLTSQTLLLSLPSSTHFLLLPANIKSYKPFIDPDSQSSFVSQTTLTLKLDEWFNKSLEVIRPSVAQWLSSLKTIKELWSVRLAITNWIRESELLANEARIVEKLFDDLHGSTASQIWISRIHHTEQNYTHKLQKVVAEFSNPVCLHSADTFASLFQLHPLPTQIIAGFNDPALKQYEHVLHNQLIGRPPPLDEVIVVLEGCVDSIQQDTHYILSTDTRQLSDLIGRLQSKFEPDAEALCQIVVRSLRELIEITGCTQRVLVFVNHLACELADNSHFIGTIGCRPTTIRGVRKQLEQLQQQVLRQWETQTLKEIFGKEKPPGILAQLISLCHSLADLGLAQRPSIQERLCTSVVHAFVGRILEKEDDELSATDLAVLIQIVELHLGDTHDERETKDHLHNLSNSRGLQDVTDRDTLAILTRSQSLLAPLLSHAQKLLVNGGKSSNLLPHGVPLQEQQHQLPFEVAKSTSRFGLLHVGSGLGSAS